MLKGKDNQISLSFDIPFKLKRKLFNEVLDNRMKYGRDKMKEGNDCMYGKHILFQ